MRKNGAFAISIVLIGATTLNESKRRMIFMLTKAVRFRFLAVLIGCIYILAIYLPLVNAQSKYPETISVLKAAYNGEVQAFHKYLAYAQKANSENYPSIANLFVALAKSESIHARNFKGLLTELGVELEGIERLEIKVSSTKKNLKNATEVELNEIDKKYPKFLQKIKPEKQEAAICYITYAWNSEKQHRDLIKRIQSATGIFFGMLAKKMEETLAQYFVCRNCGSTLTELPKDTCPICNESVSHYEKLKRIYQEN